MTDTKASTSEAKDICALHMEWDSISCPICMDHPHNAVLLICNSHEKGCRSYICDTSYRHSNCLDRLKKFKSNDNSDINPSQPGSSIHNNSGSRIRSVVTMGEISDSKVEGGDLKCPLCQGPVLGWTIVKEAREYLDLKTRSCSRESCSLLGNYRELRRHARRVHPTTRPSDVDPTRQHAWRRLEHQTEYGDVLSAIRSSNPGAIVFGDYVIEGGDHEIGGGPGEGSRHWLTTLFLFQMIGSSPARSLDEPRSSSSRSWRTHRRSSGGHHRNLWGENLLGFRDDEDDGYVDDDRPTPRRRRRFMRSINEEDP